MKRSLPVIVVLVSLGLAACGHPRGRHATPTTAGGSSTTGATTGSSVTAAPAPPPVSGPPDGPVPRGFVPASVTFDSAAEGFVLGTAPCSTPPCTSVVRTRDGGRTWHGIPAPRVPVVTSRASTPPPDGVGSIRFATPADGWAFGPGLHVTHDGGATWHPVHMSGGVAALEAGKGRGFALVAGCADPSSCPDAPWSVWTSAAGSDTWKQVATLHGRGAPAFGGSPITLHGQRGWIVLGGAGSGAGPSSTLLSTTDGGATWSPMADPCPQGSAATSVAATDTTVGILCVGGAAAGSTAKHLIVSSDGRTFRAGGDLPTAGDGGALAAPTDGTWVLATSSGASTIERSTDGGKTWTARAQFGDGGAGFADVGFTTPTQGVAVHGRPDGDTHELLMSRDGGATWGAVRFTA